jgi:signal transduction histidine kinase
VPLHAGEIEQIVLNLAANARDAMPLGGRLSIRSRAVEGERWRLEVADSGSGIPPENLGRLFDPAFTTKAAGKGTGLGLWIVRSLVEQAGGHVSVKSALGRGTVVLVELPARFPGEAAGNAAAFT